MNETEFTKIMGLYESHLQVKKLSNPGTIRLYMHSVQMFLAFCERFHDELVLPAHWNMANIGVRELEAFLQHQIDLLHWQRSTLVTCISGIKGFYQYLVESQKLPNNPIQHFKLPRDISEIGQQRYDIDKINQMFQLHTQNTLKGYQQRLLLELIYGLGLSLTRIVNLISAIPELDEGRVRLYYQNSRYRDYPFSPPAIKILKLYLKLIDSIEGHDGFWVNKKGKTMTAGQLQTLMNKYFEDHDLPTINANELRDLSVHHFSKEGADIRSLQTLRQVKQLRRLQTLKETDFDRLQNSFRRIHLRNFINGDNKQS